MKKLMVLGAGVMQAPLIKRAKELGVYTVVVGSKGNYPGLKFADKPIFQNFMDVDAVERIARAEEIDGIITCGVDMPVPTMATVSERLGLPGISHEAGQLVTDKEKMKAFFAANDIRTARHLIVRTEAEALSAFKSFDGPAMFKAIDGQGSRGIIKVTDESQVSSACAYVLAATKQDKFIVEEFLDGDEFGAQSFVLNGEVQFVLPHGDYVFHGNTGVPLGHYVPFDIDTSILEECRDSLQRFAHLAKLQTCALNVDFMLSRGHAYVLEIGARCGATMLAETVSLYYGFDYYEQMIRAALGEPTDFSPKPNGSPNATMTLISEKDGVLKRMVNGNEPNENIVEIHFDKQPGEIVHAFKLGIDRIGHVIVKGATLASAQELLAQVTTGISIELSSVKNGESQSSCVK